MSACLIAPSSAPAAVPVSAVTPATLAARLARLGPQAERWARAIGFKAAAGSILVLPAADGSPREVLFGLGESAEAPSARLAGKLAGALPAGDYRLGEGFPWPAAAAAIGFALGAYRFERYLAPAADVPRLVLPEDCDGAEVKRIVAAVTLCRDLVNTPANDLGPQELAAAARELAAAHGAAVAEIAGPALAEGFPLVMAVGGGSPRPPRLVTFSWGREEAPKVTVVGKGVVFDSGGLDLKPGPAMRLMKKDMGGAAHALALALLIMDAGLDLRLEVVLPIVENAVSGAAYRPGDVYRSRKGLTVEIGDTDAEGRLVLADALAFADDGTPEILIDFATLTGAARVALGPDIPPVYCRDDAFAAELAAASRAVDDPSWRMPLWAPYEEGLKSKIADLSNVASGGFAGSITAALFLGHFVERAKVWLHADIFAWTPAEKPGRPEGGEAQLVRALYEVLKSRYGRR